MNEVVISNTSVSIKEYKGQRVVTLSDIDAVHERPKGTARKRFNDNKGHFIYGEDYFKLQPSENRTFGITSPNGAIVLTESGYLMIIKSFTDNKAWEVQRALVKSYFRARCEKSSRHEDHRIKEKPYEYADKFYYGQPVLTSADIEFFSGITRSRTDHALRKIGTENTDYKLLTGSELAKFKKENPKFIYAVSNMFVIFKPGFDKLVKFFDIKSEIPQIMIEKKNPSKKSTRKPAPEMDDYLCSLNVLEWVRSCMSNDEEKSAINTAIRYCAMALGVTASIHK